MQGETQAQAPSADLADDSLGPARDEEAAEAAVTAGEGGPALARLSQTINKARQLTQNARGVYPEAGRADLLARHLREAARVLKGVAPAPRPPESKATRRRVLWRRDPRCFWCGRVTRFDAPEGSPDLATLEHVYARTHPKRESTRKHLPSTALACYACNHSRGAPEPPPIFTACPVLEATRAG